MQKDCDEVVRFLDINELAEVLGFSTRHVRELMDRGEIPFVEIGCRRRTPRSFLDALAAKALAHCAEHDAP